MQDIQTILDQGQPAEASKLANAALNEYGGTDIAPQLVKLKIQADVLIGASGQVNDKAAQIKGLRDLGDAAARDGNLRGALLAYDQALALVNDLALRKITDELGTRLAR